MSRLANMEYFFIVNVFFNCKYVRTNDYSISSSAISNLNSADFTTPNQSSEILILKIEMLFEFQNKRNGEIIRS